MRPMAFAACGVIVLGAAQALRDVYAGVGLFEVVPLLPKSQLANRDRVLMTDKVPALAVVVAPVPAAGISDAGV